jgi:hypothetical protein
MTGCRDGVCGVEAFRVPLPPAGSGGGKGVSAKREPVVSLVGKSPPKKKYPLGRPVVGHDWRFGRREVDTPVQCLDCTRCGLGWCAENRSKPCVGCSTSSFN